MKLNCDKETTHLGKRVTPALVIDADFVAFAADVGGTTRLARSIDAQLAGLTITVAVAYLDADAVLATLTLRAIVLLRALTLAQSGDAQVLARTVLRSFARARHSYATLLRSGITVEAERTSAGNRMVRATADRVRSTHVFPAAGIYKENV